MIDLILEPGRERSVLRRHPWVLSGSVASVRGEDSEPGSWARVSAADGRVLAGGHYSPTSTIRVRLLGFGEALADEAAGDALLADRIAAAVSRREGDPLLGSTDAMRLVNAEGDGLPGLVVDRYGDVVVVKMTTAGMQRRRETVIRALGDATQARVGYERADAHAARREGVAVHQGVLWGDAPGDRTPIHERDRELDVDVVGGQKTGFYLDQRDARDLVARLAPGRRVLDLFCYTGGFSVAAARAGAAHITMVDSSKAALERAAAHLAQNAPGCPSRAERGDVFEFLRSDRGVYDVLVVDPPPLARTRRDVPRATRAYKDAVLGALRRAAPGAYVLVFACSHHVGPDLLQKVTFGAALDAGLSPRVLAGLGAPSDHPVSIDHPEGHYLSGLLLQV